MLKIRVICVGKLKEKYWVDAVGEYAKRMRPYAGLEIVELKESRLKADGASYEEMVREEVEKYFREGGEKGKDNLHPNGLGHLRMARTIAAKLRTLPPDFKKQ